MKPLREIMRNPSGFDSFDNYSGDVPENKWLCLLTRTRDAEILEDCNFEEALKKLGGESDMVCVFRFGHWACGYWEALCVVDGSAAAKIAADIERKLESYPVVNEDAYSQKQHEQNADAVDSFIDDFCAEYGIERHKLRDDNKTRLWDAAYDSCEDGHVNEDGFYRALKLGKPKFPKLDYAAWDARRGQFRLALA